MTRIIQTYSLGIEEVQLLEAYATRHKMKKSQIIGKLLKDFLVLETCLNCETHKAHLKSIINSQGAMEGRRLRRKIKELPRPATFGYHFHETGVKYFLCTECAEISKDNMSHMVRDSAPYVRVGEKPGHKWEYTLINNLTKKDYNEYVSHQAKQLIKNKGLEA